MQACIRTRPFFPSVHRLLLQHNVSNPEAIKGTGVRGMLTRGDVLAYLGKASSPTGTFKGPKKEEHVVKRDLPSKVHLHLLPSDVGVSDQMLQQEQALDGPTIRRLIVANLLKASVIAQPSEYQCPRGRHGISAHIPVVQPTPQTFDSFIAHYVPPKRDSHPPLSSSSTAAYFDGLI
jgi:hypothetical protein